MSIGEEFCGSKSQSLQDSIRVQTVNYFKAYHRYCPTSIHYISVLFYLSSLNFNGLRKSGVRSVCTLKVQNFMEEQKQYVQNEIFSHPTHIRFEILVLIATNISHLAFHDSHPQVITSGHFKL